MKVQRRFVYTQTRLQARHGMRPDERTWRQLEAQSELASYLQVARQTGLRPWVITLHAHDSHHLLESTLLRLYRSYIDEVAHWQPRPWQPAVQWLTILMDLPTLQHLLTGNTARPWMADDTQLKAFTLSNVEQRIQAMQDSPYAPLLQGWQAGQNLEQAWLTHWQKLWPEQKPSANATLLALLQTLQEHRDQFLHAGAAQAWPLRTMLTKRLSILFRRHSYQPATAFIHLALVALDMERLRGDIIQRRLFPPRAAADETTGQTATPPTASQPSTSQPAASSVTDTHEAQV